MITILFIALILGQEVLPAEAPMINTLDLSIAVAVPVAAALAIAYLSATTTRDINTDELPPFPSAEPTLVEAANLAVEQPTCGWEDKPDFPLAVPAGYNITREILKHQDRLLRAAIKNWIRIEQAARKQAAIEYGPAHFIGHTHGNESLPCNLLQKLDQQGIINVGHEVHHEPADQVGDENVISLALAGFFSSLRSTAAGLAIALCTCAAIHCTTAWELHKKLIDSVLSAAGWLRHSLAKKPTPPPAPIRPRRRHVRKCSH